MENIHDNLYTMWIHTHTHIMNIRHCTNNNNNNSNERIHPWIDSQFDDTCLLLSCCCCFHLAAIIIIIIIIRYRWYTHKHTNTTNAYINDRCSALFALVVLCFCYYCWLINYCERLLCTLFKKKKFLLIVMFNLKNFQTFYIIWNIIYQ